MTHGTVHLRRRRVSKYFKIVIDSVSDVYYRLFRLNCKNTRVPHNKMSALAGDEATVARDLLQCSLDSVQFSNLYLAFVLFLVSEEKTNG